MKYTGSWGLCLMLLLTACQSCKHQTIKPPVDQALQGLNLNKQVHRDLPEMEKDSVLKVITLYNSTSYFLYRGRPMGFQYEMIERLAKSLHLEAHIVVAKNFDQVFNLLLSGKGDIIAFGLSITEPRKKYMAFTDYLYTTHQVLVQRKPKNWRDLPRYKIKKHLINDPIGLIGKNVYVKKNTSYYARLKHLEKEIGGKICISPITGNKTTDDIINLVVQGKINYTVADYNLASVNQTFYPILDISTPISFSQRIAWAVRKNSPKLKRAVNHWIRKVKKENFYYVLYAKYFKNKKSYRRRVSSPLFSKNEGEISPFDSIIRKNARKLEWDWRLLASLIYQESRFDADNRAWTGAGGLMQIMPRTARELGVVDIHNPVDNIRAGTTYLKKLYDRFETVPDSLQRIKFTMAAYNCGFGHVRDAQRLAKSLGKNPNRWDENVEKAMLKLSEHKYFSRPEVYYGLVRGRQPYRYVRAIFKRYKHYRQLVPRNSIKAPESRRQAS